MRKKINPRFESLKTFADVVETMVRGLKKEWVKVDMHTYGAANDKKVCFGCAATNTLCELMQESFEYDGIHLEEFRAEKFNYNITLHEL